MCTSIVYKTNDAYFGRNLDLEYSYNESITITPRNFPFNFREAGRIESHYAIMGVAFVVPDGEGKEYPLYYDAINEKGLGITGLNFVENAKFFPKNPEKTNIAPWEFIPWILSQCANVGDVKAQLEKMSFLDQPFSDELPLAELHWLISDGDSSITVESTAEGLFVYDNPVGVLTNNPPFPLQLFQLNNYMDISASDPKNTFAPELDLSYYSRGLGTHDLPGGLDSQSRFVRAVYTKTHAIAKPDELTSINQYFHILHACEQQRGCAEVNKDNFEITVYSTGYNLNKEICYYTTYDNHQITAVSMHNENLDSGELVSYPMINAEKVSYQN